MVASPQTLNTPPFAWPAGGVVLIPAFNEEESLPPLLAEVRRELPALTIVVINDGSADQTAAVARAAGVHVLDLPFNLGVGGGTQVGFQFALHHGFQYALRLDADGQHPPSEAWKLMKAMMDSPSDLIVGSRFGVTKVNISTRFRYVGIKSLAMFLSMICRARISDPTSGFWLVNRRLLHLFARNYPSDYPEPEALALLRRLGYAFREQPVVFRARAIGQSSIGRWDTFYYALKVGLALSVDRVRPVDERLSANRLCPS
jgi:glycosyltransferase involved in cell wall biosynthesis